MYCVLYTVFVRRIRGDVRPWSVNGNIVPVKDLYKLSVKQWSWPDLKYGQMTCQTDHSIVGEFTSLHCSSGYYACWQFSSLYIIILYTVL